MTFELPDTGDCVFCSIISGDSEASWEARPTDDDRVACFHNRLKWARVMLLIVPTQHMTQREFWSSDVLTDAARLTLEMGDKHCGSEGYRAISNFGLQAHQSQVHGHIHVVAGVSNQLDTAKKKSRWSDSNGTSIVEYEIDKIPYTAGISPVSGVTQRQMWDSEKILDVSRTALETTKQHSPNGYRLMSSFAPATESTLAGSNAASLFLLGGGQLGLYV